MTDSFRVPAPLFARGHLLGIDSDPGDLAELGLESIFVCSLMPFPNLLRLALLVPFAAFVLAMIAPAFLSPIVPAAFLKGAALVLIAAAGLVELFAVIVALFLLLRDGSYATPGNIVITLVASIPLAFVGFIAWVLKFGDFHI